MRKLLHVGDRVIDLTAVVAAEKGEDCLTVYLEGITTPFHFTTDEGRTIWAAIVNALPDSATPAAPAEEADLAEFQVIEMPLDGLDSPGGGAKPSYNGRDLVARSADSQMIA